MIEPFPESVEWWNERAADWERKRLAALDEATNCADAVRDAYWRALTAKTDAQMRAERCGRTSDLRAGL